MTDETKDPTEIATEPADGAEAAVGGAVGAPEAPAPSPVDQWLSMLAGEADEELFTDLLGRAAAGLDAFVTARPDAIEAVTDLLAKRLAGTPEETTWGLCQESLNSLLGVDAGYVLSWIAYDSREARLQAFEPYASPAAMALARAVTAQFGPEIEIAMGVYVNFPNDWRVITKKVLYDEVNRTYVLRVLLTKQNGDEIFLECSPDSMLGLARHFVQMLQGVVKGAFSPDRLQPFAEASLAFLNQFAEEPEPAASTAAGDDAGLAPEAAAEAGGDGSSQAAPAAAGAG